MPYIYEEIRELLKDSSSLFYSISKDISKGSGSLVKIVANADGLQLTSDKLISARNFSNVLFNSMRGGIFDDNYNIDRNDFSQFVSKLNISIAEKHSRFLRELPGKISYAELSSKIKDTIDPQFSRIFNEYLPLTFSRRHGDPSRPWNLFSIDIKKEDGTKILSYQGNWRDIFQNWEALAYSFPAYIESMISRFVNASTVDGYNPYRLMREGFDWEVLDPHDPWSNIGYWGDHQVIYLLKLLELSDNFHPGEIEKLLSQEIFSYSNIPYRIKPYAELLKNPNDSIIFDWELHKGIFKRAADTGADGKLIYNSSGEPYLVNLCEKLLVLVLSKFSNLVPEGGIWMNTQRPEWNDANNALVGRGLSMVTLYYLRRFMIFFLQITENAKVPEFRVSEEVAELFSEIKKILIETADFQQSISNNTIRKKIMDSLGKAGSAYREKVYKNNFSGIKEALLLTELIEFIKNSITVIDHSIKENRREDGLFHAYNLLNIKKEKEVSIEYLYEMLEGQVALLSSGFLKSSECLSLLQSMRKSDIFRPDQDSYMLYPRRRLQLFTEKNIISESDFSKSELLKQLLRDGNALLINRDRKGKLHFQTNIRNSNVLDEVLVKLETGIYKDLVMKENSLIHEIYENVFHHSAFTGRSGTFYKYEGLGSIYWHMVSKLQLAVKDQYFQALENNEPDEILQGLSNAYYEIKEGIGVHKTPDKYGAFTTDPYSHTPAHAGVQQPGMTGQVKEDILTRFAELGFFVRKGCIHFSPSLLKSTEFLKEPAIFSYIDLSGNPMEISLQKDTLAFTYCQTPIIYHKAEKAKIRFTRSDAALIDIDSLELSPEDSRRIFDREGYYSRIDVFLVK